MPIFLLQQLNQIKLQLINPRLTKLFFVTRLTRGVVATPSIDFPNRTPYEIGFGIHRYGMDLLYSNIPKWVQSAKSLRSYDVVKKHAEPENCDFLWKTGENSKFRYKSSEYQNFTGFFADTKGKW